mmetsp:Transcript_27337/g.46201  ORF Transcript_27337/g.46201 Transcript_27337/m.46201 type:complete len:584 (-) Transcript_27337:559-2310(-)
MENLPESIQQKLGEGEWGWDDLPTRDDATSWRDVETGCGLTKQELSRVKNARCPAQADGEGQGQAAKRRRISESIVLDEQVPLDGQVPFVTVKQKGVAGFFSEDSLLYVRAETVELWNALNDGHDNGVNVRVNGPPGTGKSTEVWAWILWKAKQDRITVTWIHLTRTKMVKVVINGAEGLITTGYGAKKDIIEYSEGSLLVVDGVVAAEQIDITRACCSWAETGRRFVLVSSSSVVVAVQEDLEANIVRFTVASWILDQYREACANDDFFEIVKAKLKCPGSGDSKEELLLSKYYFAGGCARWMFEFDYSAWKTDFDGYFEMVTNYKQLYSYAGGENTLVAVSHLRGVTLLTIDGFISKKFFFISQHTVASLGRKCKDKRTFFIHSYKKASETQNPAYEGWIFGFDFDYQLQSALEAKQAFYDSLPAENKVVESYVVFSSPVILGAAIKSLEVGKVLWAKPQLWCQKAYDFLCFWKEDDADGKKTNMVVVNATIAETHSVLLYVVNKLASDLGSDDIGAPISAIRFDFAIPVGAQFTGGDIEGRLCEWSTMNGMKWPNYVSFNQYVAEQCIQVVQVAQSTGMA